jgi:hypothetical protein
MALQPGTRLGPYEVLSLVGAGGLGAMNINGADPEGDDNQATFHGIATGAQQPPR